MESVDEKNFLHITDEANGASAALDSICENNSQNITRGGSSSTLDSI